MNTTIITLRVSEELKKDLDMLALKENRSLNNYLNTILIKFVEEQKKDTNNQYLFLFDIMLTSFSFL